VPPSSQGRHEITAGGDDTLERDVDALSFDVTPGISVSPTDGTVGSEFTVEGSVFRANESGIAIIFGSKTAKSGINANSSGSLYDHRRCSCRRNGHPRDWREGQYTDARDVDTVDFEVAPQLVVEPLEGNAGTQIEVSGNGLPASTAVTVTYDGVTKGTGIPHPTARAGRHHLRRNTHPDTHTEEHQVLRCSTAPR
jgi:hypothetical protein